MVSNNTIIPSIRKYRCLEKALSRQSEYVLLPETNIGNLQPLVSKCRQSGKKVLVHLGLLGGFKPDQAGINLLKNYYKADGIISSNPSALRYTKKGGLIAVYRVLLIGSRSLDQSLDIVKYNPPGTTEILPAEYTCQCLELASRNLKDFGVVSIAGGFVKCKHPVDGILHAGFRGIITSEPDLW